MCVCTTNAFGDVILEIELPDLLPNLFHYVSEGRIHLSDDAVAQLRGTGIWA